MRLKEIRKGLSQIRSGLAVIVIALLLVEIMGLAQIYFTYGTITKEVRDLANKELERVGARVYDRLDDVETAVSCVAFRIEDNLNRPDSMSHYLQQLLDVSPNVINCAVAFEPNYYPERGRWFEPLVARGSEGKHQFSQAGNAGHDYFQLDFYTTGISEGGTHWSEPYFNEVGNKAYVVSFTHAITDRTGRNVAVLCADITLDWLSQTCNVNPMFPSSYTMMISRKGQLMVYPADTTKVLKKNVSEIHDGRHSSVDEMNRRMMNGERGDMEVITPKGEKRLVYFGPLEGDLGWSIAVVCHKNEVYHDVHRLQWFLLLFSLIGIALMSFILWRTARSQTQMLAINAANERIGSELRIASNIQMGMLPKTFPPFPERNDIDVYATLTPAKEVGGDLYDFCIRDEKLYFCIGDVSGKGVPASLVMAGTRSMFRAFTAHESRPGRIVSMMNQSLSAANDQLMFVTYFLGILDLPTGHLRYCNAGHDAPVIITGDKATALDVVPNMPLGLDEKFQYVVQETTITPDTLLFLYTDGLTEAMDSHLKQFTGKRMMAVAQSAITKGITDSHQLVELMHASLHEFVQNAEPSDDVAMMAIQYAQPDHELLLERDITMTSDIKETTRLADFISEVTTKMGMDENVAQQVRLALEEAVVNVMEYAYPTEKTGDINVRARGYNDRLVISISDQGIAFDPTTHTTADITLSAEERPIGGLGIHLVREYMDAINYERTEHHNILTLIKKL